MHLRDDDLSLVFFADQGIHQLLTDSGSPILPHNAAGNEGGMGGNLSSNGMGSASVIPSNGGGRMPMARYETAGTRGMRVSVT